MAIFMGCSVYFWIGVLLLLAGGISAVMLKRRPARVAQGQEPHEGGASNWPFTFSVVIAVVGLAIAGNTMYQGDCTATRGACPPSIATGTGYPCAASGAACKVAGLFSGKCTNEASSIWTCECQCR
jgi:hypothetical protein